MSTLGFAHDEARDVELGRVCAHCMEPFVRANGRPASCSHCYRRLDAAERDATPLTEHDESTATFFANRARARRAIKEIKNNG